MPQHNMIRATAGVLAGMLLGCTLDTSFSAGQTPDNAQAHQARGMSLLKAGNLREARSEFATVVKMDPHSADAYLLLGVTDGQLGDYTTAVLDLRSAVKLNPRSEAAHYNLALALFHLDLEDEAITELETVVRLNPKVEPAQYNLGVLLLKKGRLEESYKHLEAARTVDPGDLEVLVYLAEACFRSGRSQRGLDLAQQGIRSDSSGEVSAKLASLLVDEGYYTEALPALQRSRSQLTPSPSLDINLARAYIGVDEPARAIELLAPLRGSQSAWQVSYLLGVAYGGTHRQDQASAAFRDAIRLKPDEAAPHYDLGRLLLDSSEDAAHKSGVSEIEEAIRLSPNENKYYATLGRWMLERNELKSAIELLKLGIKNTSEPAELEVMLGLAELRLNGATAAKPFVERAVEAMPDSGAAVHLLGSCYLKIGDYVKADQYFEKATDLSPRNDAYFFDAAEVLERLNRPSDAVAFAGEAINLKPDHAYYHYFLGKLYLKLNRNSEAIKELESCLRLDAGVDSAYYLLARAYQRAGDVKQAEAWAQQFRQLKDAQDRPVGLAPPVSGLSQVDSALPPDDHSGPGTPQAQSTPR